MTMTIPGAARVAVPALSAGHVQPAAGLLAEAAAGLGRALCDAAVWDAERTRCNWVGRRDGVDRDPGQPAVCAGALGPELYAGSAGIALFLAELHALRPDDRLLRTAAGALRRSVRYLASDPRAVSRLSLFGAHLGVAHAAARLLEVEPGAGLDGELAWLVEQMAQRAGDPLPVDVMAGAAGAVGALLRLSARPGLERCLDLALACAERLCDAAVWATEDRCHWHAEAVTAMGRPPAWTGFAHGGSGPALALLEVYARTGGERLLRTARAGLDWEDAFFSPSARNWVDTRFPCSAEDGEPAGTFQAAWCHGAPGIGIARARAAVLDPERRERHVKMARVAAGTTAAALQAQLRDPGADATLCHGAAGLSEALLLTGELLGDGSGHAPALQASAELIRQHGPRGDWPSGVNAGGPNPSLMIGWAGIGHHFLRAHAPDRVPPVLLIHP